MKAEGGPLKQDVRGVWSERTNDGHLSCPAVSQMVSLVLLPATLTIFALKSTPMVGPKSASKVSSVKRIRILRSAARSGQRRSRAARGVWEATVRAGRERPSTGGPA